MPVWDESRLLPAENLAADEALLDWCEEGDGREVLRFWESATRFVVLGYGNSAAQEVRLEACAAAGVPVLRRCSGGGTVLQGPGCLNYSLVLNLARAPELESISGANHFIMERNRAALERLLGEPVTVGGFTDLAVRGRKCSGNAQRRKRRCLLFHGTFLWGFDLSSIGRFLLPPPRQPDYRQSRAHEEFLTNLPLTAEAVKVTLREAWRAGGSFTPTLDELVRRLIEERYGRYEWNLGR